MQLQILLFPLLLFPFSVSPFFFFSAFFLHTPAFLSFFLPLEVDFLKSIGLGEHCSVIFSGVVWGKVHAKIEFSAF